MYEDLRNAIKLLKEYCTSHRCSDCPLKRAVCDRAINAPICYSLERFDDNVEEIEGE